MMGAAILLIVVQFASVTANAHGGHGHGVDVHHLQGHSVQGHSPHGYGTAATADAVSSDGAVSANRAARAEPAVQAEVSAQNTPDAPPSAYDACVKGCCGYTGCCGAALAVVSASLPPEACSLRVGFARAISVPGVDPRGLRKPPRLPPE
jgi:hypothetical protein